MSDLAFASASELAQLIRNKSVSAVELLQHYLARVDKDNPELYAIVVDMRELALQQAADMDAALAKGAATGPFHGVPMTVKESYNVAATPTTWGNPEWRENVPREDAEAIKKLKACGVNIFGKTNVPLSLADFQS
jgi:amidase